MIYVTACDGRWFWKSKMTFAYDDLTLDEIKTMWAPWVKAKRNRYVIISDTAPVPE